MLCIMYSMELYLERLVGMGGAGDGVLQGVEYVAVSYVAGRWRVPAIALDSL